MVLELNFAPTQVSSRVMANPPNPVQEGVVGVETPPDPSHNRKKGPTQGKSGRS